jgi:hypothetical protein
VRIETLNERMRDGDRDPDLAEAMAMPARRD